MESLVNEISMLENYIKEKENNINNIDNELIRSTKIVEIELLKQNLLGMKIALNFIKSEQ